MDIKLTLETKQINPGVINLKQHTNNTDTLVFVMEEYMYETTDLSKLNAYAVCDMSGRIDEAKLTTEVVDGKLRITWKVTGYTTEVDGTITYQIVFKNIENEESKVWYSHKAIIFVNSSINADEYIAAKYPSILQQWEERMNSIDGEVDADLEEIREAVQTTTDNAAKTDADAQKTAEDAERTQKLKEYVESIVNYEPSESTGKEVTEARGDFLTLGQRLDDMDEKSEKKTEDVEIILSAASWNDGKYTYTDERITSSTDADLETSPSITDEQYEEITNARISRTIELNDGSMVLSALGDVPTTDIPLILKVRSWQ